MCDCYDHKCLLCDETVPVHIGDYAYPREDVEVLCKAHIVLIPGWEIFKAPKCAIRLCGGKLRPWDEDVSPNESTAESVWWNAPGGGSK